MELLRGISQKVERVVLNALASDAALPPNFLIKVSRQYAKKHGALGDYSLASPSGEVDPP